jgi:hypothetical protein
MEPGETPPTDNRFVHDFFLVDGVVLLFCVVFAGVVGEVVGAGSFTWSAGCLAGNGDEGVEFGDNWRIAGDLGAVYPISPILEGSGSASGRASIAGVSVEVEEDAEDIIQDLSLSKSGKFWYK